MNNPFPYTQDNKRYHTWNYHLRQTYHEKLVKIALDGGFSCPNRDGTCGIGGCIFCSERGSGEFAGQKQLPLLKQYELGKIKYLSKWPNCRGIAYFQNFTNTHAPLEYLQSCFEPFLEVEDCVAIAIATRADALDETKIAYLETLNKKKPVYIELGLQSTFDETANFIHRGHTYETFLHTISLLAKTDLKIIVHLINGLPCESKEMMLENAKRVGKLPIHGLKIHMLHVIKNTQLADEYDQEPFPLITRDEYIKLIVDQLEYLPPHIVIQRLTGDGVQADLIAPLWTSDKKKVLNGIDQAMVARDTWQGKNVGNK
ncbi:MAG: TIGR01212 family radical SAM protein [Longicatena sp.]